MQKLTDKEIILAVLDTNILASAALNSSSVPGQTLTQWAEGKFVLIISEHILQELERTLSKPYFRKLLKAHVINAFIAILKSDAIITPVITNVEGVATHPEDDIVLATAESGKASYIVTGDHGLQSLKEFKGIQIVNPKRFVEILLI